MDDKHFRTNNDCVCVGSFNEASPSVQIRCPLWSACVLKKLECQPYSSFTMLRKADREYTSPGPVAQAHKHHFFLQFLCWNVLFEHYPSLGILVNHFHRWSGCEFSLILLQLLLAALSEMTLNNYCLSICLYFCITCWNILCARFFVKPNLMTQWQW